MIIYNDKFTNKEMLSDTYRIDEIEGGAILKVPGKIVTETAAGEVDIGANASAEEQSEEYESGSTTGVNVVLAHKLQEAIIDKKTFAIEVKAYMKKLKARLQEDGCEDIQVFEASASKFVKSILPEFKEYQFFVGEDDHAHEGMIIPVKWENDGQTPILYFYKHGLNAEKV